MIRMYPATRFRRVVLISLGRKVPGVKIWSIVVGLCLLFGGVEAALTLGVMVRLLPAFC